METVASVEVLGVFQGSLARASVNLELLAGREAAEACNVEPVAWYPASRFQELVRQVVSRYPSPDPILERIGIEMMKLWYDPGPGRSIIRTSVDFLRYQTGSEGYHSLVRGPDAEKGAFTLVDLDEATGHAVIDSSTPFSRTMERGVLLGGLRLTGDANYVNVTNAPDPSRFVIEFH
jgi:hypothetical protein